MIVLVLVESQSPSWRLLASSIAGDDKFNLDSIPIFDYAICYVLVCAKVVEESLLL